MSYKGLLTQRCSVLRMEETAVDGAAVYSWSTLATNISCRVDLMLQKENDPPFIPEPGRPADRVGTAFFLANFPGLPGDQIKLTDGGVEGSFALDGNLDRVIGRQGKVHHIEAGVKEVAQAIGAV